MRIYKREQKRKKKRPRNDLENKIFFSFFCGCFLGRERVFFLFSAVIVFFSFFLIAFLVESAFSLSFSFYLDRFLGRKRAFLSSFIFFPPQYTSNLPIQYPLISEPPPPPSTSSLYLQIGVLPQFWRHIGNRPL